MQERYPYVFQVVYGTLAVRQVNTRGEYLEHCFSVFQPELMVLLTMLYPGEPSRAVESDKVCTCFTGLLDVCVQALAMQLHALIHITSMMSYLQVSCRHTRSQSKCSARFLLRTR